MAITSHKVAGVYSDRQAAREGAQAIREAGFSSDVVVLADRDDWQLAFADSDEMEKRASRSVLAGAGAGAGIGAAGAIALVAAQVSVVSSAPILSVLVGAGVGAIAGTAIAGVTSASLREPDFRNLVREAVESGRCVVIVRAGTEADALRAQSVIAGTTQETLDQFGAAAS